MRGVNGNTIRKSKYPERQLYTDKYSEPTDRRAVRNRLTGEPENFDVDENGDKIPGTERYTSKSRYLEDELYDIAVDPKTGNAKYTHSYADKKIKLTPFKKFTKIIMKHYWKALDDNGMLAGIKSYQKSMFYIKLKAFAWEYIKYWAATQILKMDPPNGKEEKIQFEKSSGFKHALDQLIAEILSTPLENTFNTLMVVYNAAREAIIVDDGDYPEGDMYKQRAKINYNLP